MIFIIQEIKHKMMLRWHAKKYGIKAKVNINAMPHTYIFFTLQLYIGDLPQTYIPQPYWQFLKDMAVTLFSGHFLLPHGLGMRLV